MNPEHSKPPLVQRRQTGLVSSSNSQAIRITNRARYGVIWSNGADLTTFYSALSAGVAAFATAWNAHHAGSQVELFDMRWPVQESSSVARAMFPFGLTATYITWTMHRQGLVETVGPALVLTQLKVGADQSCYAAVGSPLR
jgi:hypothetical protein